MSHGYSRFQKYLYRLIGLRSTCLPRHLLIKVKDIAHSSVTDAMIAKHVDHIVTNCLSASRSPHPVSGLPEDILILIYKHTLQHAYCRDKMKTRHKGLF